MNTTTNTNNTQNQNPIGDATSKANVTAAMSPADKLRAKLKATAPASNSEKPITVKAWLEALSTPATIDKFFEGELNGTPEPPLVILTSHVNRSEVLKAATAAIKLVDITTATATRYGLSPAETIRLITKMTIQAYTPADLEAPEEAPAPDRIATPEELAASNARAAAHAATLNQTPAPDASGELFETGTSEAPAPTEAPAAPAQAATATAKASGKNKGRK